MASSVLNFGIITAAVIAMTLVPLVIYAIVGRYVRWRMLKRRRAGHGYSPQRTKAVCALILVGASSGAVVSCAFSERPVFGLVMGALLGGLSEKRVAEWMEFRKAREIEMASIGFLRSVQGLLRAGIGFSSALFQLSALEDASWLPFSKLFEASFLRYHRGTSLGDCLARVKTRSGVASLSLSLGLIEIAYRQGLPVLPLIERTLEWLEQDICARSRIRDLSVAATCQLGIAVCLPWVVFFALSHFEPELWGHFRDSPSFWPVIAMGVGFEAVGTYVVRRCTCFF